MSTFDPHICTQNPCWCGRSFTVLPPPFTVTTVGDTSGPCQRCLGTGREPAQSGETQPDDG